MILVDTSIWVDHFRTGLEPLAAIVNSGRVLSHPFIIGELAVGDLRNWAETIAMLRALPSTKVASEDEYLFLIVGQQLARTGLGFVDVHLLAACRLKPGTRLWTRDKRLAKFAEQLGVAWTDA